MLFEIRTRLTMLIENDYFTETKSKKIEVSEGEQLGKAKAQRCEPKHLATIDFYLFEK